MKYVCTIASIAGSQHIWLLAQGFSIECVRRPEGLSDRIVGEKILLGRSGRLNVPCGRVCPPVKGTCAHRIVLYAHTNPCQVPKKPQQDSEGYTLKQSSAARIASNCLCNCSN